MSKRGLVVALLCAVIGLAGGAVVAYAVQPRPASGGEAAPVTGLSPSVPAYVTPTRPYRHDISYPPLATDLPLNTPHEIKNHQATWDYHVPQGWTAYPWDSNTPLRPKQIDKAKVIRFKPTDEPPVGGYSLYLKMLDNKPGLGITPRTMVQSKVFGFQDYNYPDRQILKKTPSSVYISYRDPSTNYHRWNFFSWYAVPSDPTTTASLQVSVAGRQVDAPGLRALLNRFADNLVGH